MRRLGVVGLVSLDHVDGGIPRLGGAPVYAARALRLIGQPAVVATKLADEDRPRLAGLGLPVVAESAPRTIEFRIENDGEGRRMAIDGLGEPWSAAEARGWLTRALADADWVHAGALTRADFPADAGCPGAWACAQPGRAGPRAAGRRRRPRPRCRLRPGHPRHIGVLKLARDELDALGLELTERSLGSPRRPRGGRDLGQAGAVVYADGLAEHVPTIPLAGVDPTGAGDSWTTAYLCFRRRRHSPVSAARLANGALGAILGR